MAKIDDFIAYIVHLTFSSSLSNLGVARLGEDYDVFYCWGE